jgi:anti-sigma B factor antagonist
MNTEPDLFSITRSTRGACEVVGLAGELDMATAAAVSELLDALAESTSPVIADLSELSFIDSSGIHAVLGPRPYRGAFVLVCPPGNVHRVLSVAKLDGVRPMYETLEEALAELA